MGINLLLWLVAWAILTTVLVILLLYRARLASREVTGIRIDDTEVDLPEVQRKFAQKMEKIDSFVRRLTVASVVMIFGIGVLWLYQLVVR